VVPEKGGGGGGLFSGGGGASFGGGGFSASSADPGLGADVVMNTQPMSITRDVINDLVVNAVAVPEPGAWALMLLGFGAAGTTLRLRRRHLRYG
jgi:hypothetical protein